MSGGSSPQTPGRRAWKNDVGIAPILPYGLPWWLSGKELACQLRTHRFDPGSGKIPWRRKWQPTLVFLPGKSHRHRSLAGYSHKTGHKTGHDWGTKSPPTCQGQTFSPFCLFRPRGNHFQCSSFLYVDPYFHPVPFSFFFFFFGLKGFCLHFS